MSFTAPNYYAYQRRDDEPLPQPQCIEPWLLDLRNTDVPITNEQIWPPSFPVTTFVGPEGAPLSVERPVDVQQSSYLPYPSPHVLSESPHPHSSYLPCPDSSTHEGMSVDGDTFSFDTFLYDNPFTPSHPPTDATQATDPSWAESVVVDGPLSLSPIYLPQALPLDHLIQVVEGEHWYQAPGQPSSPSSTGPISTVQTFFEGTPASNVTMVASLPTTDPEIPVRMVTVLGQRSYKPRQSSLHHGVLPSIRFEPYGYPVSSALEGKTRRLKDLPKYDQVAFENFTVGQKLSWRFLFDGFADFQQQFNVLGAHKIQPTTQRIVVETAKALAYFKEKEPRFTHSLARLVILEIVLVSSASVQAKIGLMGGADVNPVGQS